MSMDLAEAEEMLAASKRYPELVTMLCPPPMGMRADLLVKKLLAEDYIGYIVPAYNYVLSPTNPYLSEADGDHYEETYSLGPLVEQQAIHPILQLLQYR